MNPASSAFIRRTYTGSLGSGTPLKIALYKAKSGMKEHVGLLRQQGLPIPAENPSPVMTIQKSGRGNQTSPDWQRITEMSFRRRVNRHDEWQRFRKANKDLIGDLQFPEHLFVTEERFREFLTTGSAPSSVEQIGLNLQGISDERFLRVEKVINRYFHDGWDQYTLTAFFQERLRRFGRYD
jgi:hypothetical protein